jgi:hypothetical protein
MKEKGKQTGRSVQTSLFIGSLMKEMSKLAEGRGMLVARAEEYLSRGCSRDETEELLSIDGFDKDLIASYLSSTASSEPQDNEGEPVWGFELKGSCGDRVTHEDLDIEIRASTKADAVKRIQEVIDTEKDAGLDSIVDVYEL